MRTEPRIKQQKQRKIQFHNNNFNQHQNDDNEVMEETSQNHLRNQQFKQEPSTFRSDGNSKAVGVDTMY